MTPMISREQYEEQTESRPPISFERQWSVVFLEKWLELAVSFKNYRDKGIRWLKRCILKQKSVIEDHVREWIERKKYTYDEIWSLFSEYCDNESFDSDDDYDPGEYKPSIDRYGYKPSIDRYGYVRKRIETTSAARLFRQHMLEIPRIQWNSTMSDLTVKTYEAISHGLSYCQQLQPQDQAQWMDALNQALAKEWKSTSVKLAHPVLPKCPGFVDSPRMWRKYPYVAVFFGRSPGHEWYKKNCPLMEIKHFTKNDFYDTDLEYIRTVNGLYHPSMTLERITSDILEYQGNELIRSNMFVMDLFLRNRFHTLLFSILES